MHVSSAYAMRCDFARRRKAVQRGSDISTRTRQDGEHAGEVPDDQRLETLTAAVTVPGEAATAAPTAAPTTTTTTTTAPALEAVVIMRLEGLG